MDVLVAEPQGVVDELSGKAPAVGSLIDRYRVRIPAANTLRLVNHIRRHCYRPT